MLISTFFITIPHKKYKLIMIFYFSCTGNTRWAAHKIAEATGDTLIDIAAELRKADEEDATDKERTFSYTLSADESLAFCFPVHGWRPPLAVRDFIRRLRISKTTDNYCYAVCTAGDTVGEAMDILEADLAAVGIKTDSCISLLMPESYVGLPFMDVDKAEAERRKKTEADRRLQNFIADIKCHKAGIHDITVGRWPRINSRLIGEAFTKWIIGDRPFRVDAEKCIKCGKCAAVCPVGDISFVKGCTPQWKHNGKCLSCFACYHHCPTRAIEYGGRTKGKGQYYYEKNEKTIISKA